VKKSNSNRLWLVLALLFWLLNVMLHLAFSNWLVVSYRTPFGPFVLRDHTRFIAVTVCLLIAGYLFHRWRGGVNRTVAVLAWLGTAGAMVTGMTIITTTDVEMIHFLQYGLLAWMLARALDPDKTRWPLQTLMFLTLGLGIVDELNQYFYLTRNNSSYIDFNDFVLNQIGAVAGLLARYGFSLAPTGDKAGWSRLQFVTLGAYSVFAVGVLLLAVTGHLRYRPDHPVPPGGIDYAGNALIIYFQREPALLSHWQPTFTSGTYYVMGAVEGFLVILSISALLGLFGRCSRLSQTQQVSIKTDDKYR